MTRLLHPPDPHADPDQWLSVATAVATEAGALVMDYYAAGVLIDIKEGDARNLVTEADLAVDALISSRLQRAFPAHALLTEEGTGAAALDDAVPTWVVDPIDGTSNFAHRLPLFAVSIGLRHEGRGEVGVIHAPALGWTFSTRAGGGAFLNGLPLEVSEREQLGDAIVAADWPRAPARRQRMIAIYEALSSRVHTLRSFGSAALGLAAVAAGWLDLYANYQLAAWDVAAGELLVREAGGQVSALDGGPWQAAGGSVLVSNGRLHGAAQPLIAPHLTPPL